MLNQGTNTVEPRKNNFNHRGKYKRQCNKSQNSVQSLTKVRLTKAGLNGDEAFT